MQRSRTRAAIVVALLLTAGCANDGRSATATTEPIDIGDVRLVASLEPFDACDTALSHLKDLALERVGPYGLDGGVTAYADDMVAARETMAGAEETAAAPQSDAGMKSAPATTAAGNTAATDSDGTGTNNQEAGVDEADIVKRDGNRVVHVRGEELIVIELVDGVPQITGRTRLTAGGNVIYADRLFLVGDRAYVLGTSSTYEPASSGSSGDIASRAGMMSTAVLEVSLAGSPEIVGHRLVTGSLLDGRLANGTLRLVLSSPGGTGLGFVYPDGTRSAEERAAETNRRVVEESTIEDWLPTVSDGSGATPLLPCDRLYRPAEPSGFSTLSILTIADGLGSLAATGVLADGQITYASDDHLYVATNQWQSTLPAGAVAKGAPGNAEHTDVHSFAINGAEPAAYEASGRVDGHVLNQYSMSEQDGDLRIATTVSAGGGRISDCPPNANCTAEIAASEGSSRIVVLRPEGDVLRQIGMVDGLGPSEQIKSVRYVGATAYVVTFRQTDPFYVIDLTDPAAPRKLGELKVPGFSSYLHPVGEHLVLGVGSDATDEGRITGGKVSLYDTSDPAAPRELDSETYLDLGFMVDSDPKAFAWDPVSKRAFLPYYGNCWDRCISQMANGVLVLTVDGGTITDAGRIGHDESAPAPGSPTTTAPQAPDTTIPVTTSPETIPDTTVPAPDQGVSSPGSEGTGATEPAVAPAVEPMPMPMPIEPPMCETGDCSSYYVPMPTITRAFVIGDLVVTLSDVGIATHTIDGLALRGFARF